MTPQPRKPPHHWCVFGFDPGWHGAIVFVDQDHNVVHEVGFQSTTGKRAKKVCHKSDTDLATNLHVVESVVTGPGYGYKLPAVRMPAFGKVCALAESRPTPAIFFGHIERVTSGGQAGRRGVHTQFLFGNAWGLVRGIIATWKARCPDLEYTFVPPAAWQSKTKCLTKGNKNISKAKAQKRFPDYKVTHRNADALLLAHCAWRYVAGKDSYPLGMPPEDLIK